MVVKYVKKKYMIKCKIYDKINVDDKNTLYNKIWKIIFSLSLSNYRIFVEFFIYLPFTKII